MTYTSRRRYPPHCIPGCGAPVPLRETAARMALCAAGLALAACSAPGHTSDQVLPRKAADALLQAPAPPRAVVYDCDTGGPVTLHWPEGPQGPATLEGRGGRTVTLQPQPTASGFAYAQGPIVVMGKGREIQVTHGRVEPQRCTAR